MQHQRATIGEDGSIILPGQNDAPAARKIVIEEEVHENDPVQYDNDSCTEHEEVQHVCEQDPAALWTVIEEEIEATSLHEAADAVQRMEQAKQVWMTVRGNIRDVAGDMLTESTQQYRSSISDGMVASEHAVKSFGSVCRRMWAFLRQPVWIPGKKKQPVQYSRGTLFVLDTLRFGGTFAGLFAVLFVALNFQSFLSIGSSYILPLAEVTGIVQAKDTEEHLAEQLKDMTATENADSGELSQFLPPVGPPDNRLIIPKLKLNVPIVIPSTDALVAENWARLEEDIQESLQDGVVHYPGTARPGKPGNFFVTGHSSYYPWAPGQYKSVFARLHDLNVGDEYWVFYNGDRHRYVITGEKEIKPSDVTVLDQPVDKRISTLMTCTPVGTTLRRLILTAQEVDPVSGKPLEVGEHATEQAPKLKMEMLPI